MPPDACELTAEEAAQAVRERRLSPLDLVDAALARISALDERVQAFCFVDQENARRMAAALGVEASRGMIRGALHGVPFAVKDIICTEGVPTEAGSALLKGHTPSHDATVVARLKQAGAILLGKTHTTEFANVDPAPTRNPWNAEHTPGGSSSGSAAAVAARMVPLALGTQTGGSTLRPAAYCGVVGFKPSFGRVSLHGVLPLTWCMDHVGFIARSVSDVAIALAATAGFDPADPSSARTPVPALDLAAPAKPPVIGRVRHDFFEDTDPDVTSAMEMATRAMSQAGAAIREARLPASFAAIHAAQHVAEEVEIAEIHAERYAEHAALYRPGIRQTIELGFLVPPELYVRAQRIRRQFRADMADMLKPLDAILLPAIAAPAPHGLGSTGNWRFQSPWSSAGLPSISLPCGVASAGLPVAIQLVGAPFAEAALLGAARWCESLLPRMPAPPLAAG